MSDRIDLVRELGDVYRARATPALVTVPPLAYAMIDGDGDPNTDPAYAAAIAALYAISYGAKYALRPAGGPDIKVMPLESLWDLPAGVGVGAGDRSVWRWTAMIAQPEPVTDEVFTTAVAAARAKAPAAAMARREVLDEGRAAQVLHVGPYADEGPTIARLHAFIASEGLMPAGRHHEIYLRDPRRTAPERLTTIIRQPVAAG